MVNQPLSMTKQVVEMGINVARTLGSFVFAWRGIKLLVRHENNARVHLLASVCTLAVGTWLGLSTVEWGVIVLLTALVWVAEAVNSAVERLVDLVSPQHNRLAGDVKDLAAGAVLLAAIAAVVGGSTIIAPKLWAVAVAALG
jgi:diacylglycerol kinase